jgi:hypothetical protein
MILKNYDDGKMPKNNLNVTNHCEKPFNFVCGAKVSNITLKRNADKNTIRPLNKKRGPQKQWEAAPVSQIFPCYFMKWPITVAMRSKA